MDFRVNFFFWKKIQTKLFTVFEQYARERNAHFFNSNVPHRNTLNAKKNGHFQKPAIPPKTTLHLIASALHARFSFYLFPPPPLSTLSLSSLSKFSLKNPKTEPKTRTTLALLRNHYEGSATVLVRRRLHPSAPPPTLHLHRAQSRLFQ